MSLRIWSCEGERIVELVDVENNYSEESYDGFIREVMSKELSEEEYEVYCDVVYEGWIVKKEDLESIRSGEIEGEVRLKFWSLEEYVKDFKNWYKRFF